MKKPWKLRMTRLRMTLPRMRPWQTPWREPLTDGERWLLPLIGGAFLLLLVVIVLFVRQMGTEVRTAPPSLPARAQQGQRG